MINYYEYDTSPKKEESYGGTATKVRTKTDYAGTRTKRKVEEPDYNDIYKKRRSHDYLEQNRKSRLDEEHIDVRKMARQAKVAQSRKNARHIAEVGGAFIILFTISYRYALINSKFNEKENLKDELAQIQKENAQVQVSIEQGMNNKNIEKEAQERLGMQKLDANNKIYVNLPKKDYIESASKKISEEKSENWISKLLNILKGN